MRIARLESFTTPEVGFVRLTTDGGETGWGQMSTYHADITAQVLHRQVAPWVLGRRIDGDDPVADFLDLAAFVHEREHKYPGSYVRRALAGVDTALWDLLGRMAGKPVATLIGGGPGRVRAYASSMKRDITPEDEADRCAGFATGRASMPSSSVLAPNAGAAPMNGQAGPRRSSGPCRGRWVTGW